MVKVPALPDTFYANWRVRCKVVTFLHDDGESPPETLLQSIWQHQRLLRNRLKTAGGEPVLVLHPGFRSLEGGPDFRQAVIRIGDGPAIAGDVEVDIHASGWRSHNHYRNPAFKNVILHVVWETEARAAEGPPRMPLREVLDAPVGELSVWLAGESAGELPELARGRCCAPLGRLSAEALTKLLHEAAEIRFRGKAEQFQAKARQVGWEQSLWEGIFRALGYKHNVWPMHRLAELRPRWLKPGSDPLAVQSRLLGIGDLLPADVTRGRNAADHYVRRAWDLWWREREEFSDCLLPRSAWRLHGVRPANHPQRRLALAAHWALADNLPGRLADWCAREVPRAALCASLGETLQAGPDEFWSWHWSLRSARLKRAQPLFGADRVTDLAINVVLPWLWIRAEEGKNASLLRGVEERYFSWPPAQDNSVLKLARQRLLGSSSRRLLRDAAAQQGLIQIVRDFCEHSDSTCAECKLPALVEELWARNRVVEID